MIKIFNTYRYMDMRRNIASVSLIGRLKAYRSLIHERGSYLYLTGWMQSKQNKKPLDRDGNPIPWMNFSAIRLLNERLRPDFNLFEFGSGFSTHFYARKVKTVTSIEYDKKWFDYLKPLMPDNVSMHYKEQDVDGYYCRSISMAGRLYDVVIVDGRDRINCVKQSLLCLTKGGVLVLDDSQRERYGEAIQFAKEKGFRALELEGLKPGGNGIDKTTFIYRDRNCFDI